MTAISKSVVGGRYAGGVYGTGVVAGRVRASGPILDLMSTSGFCTGYPHRPSQNRAEEHYRKALALAVQLGMRPFQGHCHLGLGRLAWRRSDADAAGAALAAAQDLFQELRMTFWLRQLEAVARGR
jgi:hypothetical protein